MGGWFLEGGTDTFGSCFSCSQSKTSFVIFCLHIFFFFFFFFFFACYAPAEKESTLKGKDLLHMGSKSFPFRVDLFY